MLNGAFTALPELPLSLGRGGISNLNEVCRLSPFSLENNLRFYATYNLPYGLTELAHQAVGASIPIKNSTLFISADNFGSEIYRENSLFVAYSLYQEKSTIVAINFTFNNLNSVEVNYHSLNGGINLNFALSDQLNLNGAMQNLYPIYQTNEAAISSSFLALSYHNNSNLDCYLALEKEKESPLVVKTGVELTILEKIKVVAGYNFEPALYSSGMEFSFKDFALSYAFSYHETLGFTQSCGLVYSIK